MDFLQILSDGLSKNSYKLVRQLVFCDIHGEGLEFYLTFIYLDKEAPLSYRPSAAPVLIN